MDVLFKQSFKYFQFELNKMDNASKVIEAILTKTVGKKNAKPVQEHEIVYDSNSETLEPIYFWLIDFMNNMFGGDVEKLIDNFTSSPGSGHFSELSQKKTILQEQAMKTLGAISQVIRTIVNLIYDLKDFEIRLKEYEKARSEDKVIKNAGMLALKQIWMDNVDVKRGQGSINALASGNLQFTTLRDAFMIADTVKEAGKIDLNDRTKRILKPRVAEFLEWKKLSEQELQKRFSIEKNYLKSQVNTLQLYSKWMKPYLQSAAELEMGGSEGSAELVTAFNTIIFELSIMGKRSIDVEQSILENDLPLGIKRPKRKYYSVVIVDLHFRGIPGKAGQHYTFGGRATVNFKAYTLNEEEFQAYKEELAKTEIGDVMKLIEGSTTESLDELKEDIDYFLEGKEREEIEEIEGKSVDTNPFSALFSLFMPSKKEKVEGKKLKIDLKNIKKDTYAEKLLRKLAGEIAKQNCFDIYDVYKKSHGMPSYQSPFE